MPVLHMLGHRGAKERHHAVERFVAVTEHARHVGCVNAR